MRNLGPKSYQPDVRLETSVTKTVNVCWKVLTKLFVILSLTNHRFYRSRPLIIIYIYPFCRISPPIPSAGLTFIPVFYVIFVVIRLTYAIFLQFALSRRTDGYTLADGSLVLYLPHLTTFLSICSTPRAHTHVTSTFCLPFDDILKWIPPSLVSICFTNVIYYVHLPI